MKRYGFAVIGLGKFGYYLAKELAGQGQEVLCVERQQSLVEEVAPFVTDAVVGDASKREVLEDLGLGQVEKIVVAVGNLTQSVLITLYLREMRVRYILAKANDEDHAKLLSLVGADEVIIPERNSARKVARTLVTPNVTDFLPMLPDYCIAQVKAPAMLVGKSLEELNLRRRYNVYVIGVRDEAGSRFTLMPKAEYRIEEDSILYVIGRKDDVAVFSALE